jgi:hypothetical protein
VNRLSDLFYSKFGRRAFSVMSSSTIAAARASNEQRNCIADARQIMDMHLKRLGLLGDFEEVM